MKKMIILLACLSLTACSEDENKVEQEPSIYGVWQLTEVYSGPPSGQGWSKVENGYTIEISRNLSFDSGFLSDCKTGTVQINSSEITLKYDCSEITLGVGDPDGTLSYSYSLGTNLELIPLFVTCFEGCAYRFEKIAEIQIGE